MHYLTPDKEMDKVWQGFLQSLTLEERLAGATAEEILNAVSPEQREQLRLLLLQEGEEAKPRKPKRGKKS